MQNTPTHRLGAGLRRWCGAAALAVLLALPVQAVSIFPETPMDQLRQIPCLRDSGYYLYSRGDDRSLLAQAQWSTKPLNEYVEAPAAPDAARGLELAAQNQCAGVQVTHSVYTPEEIREDPALGCVQLFYFPPKDPGARYALVITGNANLKTGIVGEGASAAWVLHQQGYGVFVLRHRTFFDAGDNAPLQDVCRAVEYITQNAAALQVSPEDYAVVGFSSGGHLAGLYGSPRIGYGRCGLPAPAALLLAYPINNFFEVKPLYHLMLDYDRLDWRYYWANVSDQVEADYPPTFHWYGLNDPVLLMFNRACQGPALEQALTRHGVEHQCRVYQNAPHAIGTGVGTDAEGWLEEAAAFWDSQVEETRGE